MKAEAFELDMYYQGFKKGDIIGLAHDQRAIVLSATKNREIQRLRVYPFTINGHPIVVAWKFFWLSIKIKLGIIK